MTNPIEMAMYDISQFFLYPVLLAIAALFVHAFYALGAFAWQAWQRTQGKPAGFELHALRRADPGCDLVALETVAVKRLEFARIATRVAPMLGLVATMIPMGPALKALADGALQDVSRSLMIAFSAVILALLAAAMILALGDGPHLQRRPDAPRLRLGEGLFALREPRFRASALAYFGHSWELYAFWTLVPLMVTVMVWGTLRPVWASVT